MPTIGTCLLFLSFETRSEVRLLYIRRKTHGLPSAKGNNNQKAFLFLSITEHHRVQR